ncbi:MAG: hypothetical protein JST54_21375 [Deltaproteobacteria bacterium]|nr:hypothetical protein [Deltaproteobacteria bacterium]
MLFTCVALLAAAAAPPAPLDQARSEMAALRYDKAETALRAGLSADGNDRATLLALLSLTGEVKAIVGKADESTAAFKELLYLAPDTAPSASWSPKVSSRFTEAKAWLAAAAPLSVEPADPISANGQVQAVVLEVHDAALKLATQVRLNVNGTPTTVAVPADGKIVAPITPATEVKYWAELLGPAGATLLALGAPTAPLMAKAAPGVPLSLKADAAPADHSALRPYSYAVAGAGVALLAGSTSFALGASSDRSKLANAAKDANGRVTGLSQQDAFSLYSEGNSRASTAVFLGATGAAVLAAGVGLWIYSRPVAVVPTPSGVAVAGRFP